MTIKAPSWFTINTPVFWLESCSSIGNHVFWAWTTQTPHWNKHVVGRCSKQAAVPQACVNILIKMTPVARLLAISASPSSNITKAHAQLKKVESSRQSSSNWPIAFLQTMKRPTSSCSICFDDTTKRSGGWSITSFQSTTSLLSTASVLPKRPPSFQSPHRPTHPSNHKSHVDTFMVSHCLIL